MKETFIPKTFTRAHEAIITAANSILSDYAAQGYDLSLRQLYYQFVTMNLIENKEQSYKRLGSIIQDARDAGRIDWNMIVDRGRAVSTPPAWEKPASILESAAYSFRIDLWKNQPCRIICMVEKQALEGVLAPVCEEERIEFSANKGYASASHMYSIAKKIRRYVYDNKDIHIIYLGDHDPSGLDMGRDVLERLELYSGSRVSFHRVALNMDQIEEYNPPPNPTKMDDSRASGYVDEFGESSWELDALSPSVLAALVRDKVEELRDPDIWEVDSDKEDRMRNDLATLAQEYQGKEY